MATKREVYTKVELEWAEEKLLEWKDYIDKNPFHSLTDRVDYKQTKTGGVIPMVISRIEDQIKCIRDTMKEYLALLQQVDKMRETEEQKAEAKGDGNIPYRMKK